MYQKKSNKNCSCIRYNMLKGWWQIVRNDIEYEKWFPQRLTQLRMQKGVSARDMSLSIGQNTGYINSIESGKNFPTMKNFFYICEYLHITPKEFFEKRLCLQNDKSIFLLHSSRKTNPQIFYRG